MEVGSTKILIATLFVCFALAAEIVIAINSLTSTQFLKDPEAIISDSNVYKLGFFSPENSTDRYVGILYNQVPVLTVLWVANSNKPLSDSSGILAIANDGNLVLLNGQNEIFWSSNFSSSVSNSTAQLQDTGNLVLLDNTTGETIWESFQSPSNTFYSKMKLSVNRSTGEKLQLTSWRSVYDPSTGNFSCGLSPVDQIPELFIWKDGFPYFRSGPWNRQVFIGVPIMNSAMVDGITLVDDGEGYVYFSFSYSNQSFLSDFILTPQGQLEQTYWVDGMSNWTIQWKYPTLDCDFYGKCGPFGSCSSKMSPICSCLGGFEPTNFSEWNAEKWSSGCSRKQQLQCERVNSTGAGGEQGKEDGFLKLGNMKVPDFAVWSRSTEDQCRNECLANCSCLAYAYDSGIGCMSWSGSLVDLQKFSTGGIDLYIRLAYSELGKSGTKKIVVSLAVVGTIVAAICAFTCWRLISNWIGRKKKFRPLSDKNEGGPTISNMNPANLHELRLFDLETLRAATNNFDLANKLGQGGFGPVYKGKLPDRQEIAVKTLSRASGQGSEEFMTEVEVISKLQHRNLVKLFGCCVEGEERMLVYEYLENKSLDAFLFGDNRQEFLDWETRLQIVNGICRGLLYLHKDSRLKIIHRDLKASNILLDENMNPKISDFGLARIFKGAENEANTRRVVGTYGYMSPEYAMEGMFSEKSDVFSFGVLLLEIISGRRNTSFYDDERALNLLGYAWKLWNENNIVGLIDPAITDPSRRIQILRCIHAGLLCTQESANDRPSMPTIISMLNSEIVALPTPKQPAFTERQVTLQLEDTSRSQMVSSATSDTVSMVQGR